MTLPLRLVLALFLSGIVALHAADATPPAATTTEVEAQQPKTFAAYLEQNGVKLTHGPAKVQLGKQAEFSIAGGEHFVGPDSLKRYCDLTQNYYSPEQVGVVVSDVGWTLSFRYEDTGHVKDDEKEKLDADDMMKTMREGIAQSNEDRKQKGWDEMRLDGWVQPPRYDEKTHGLRWALRLASSSDGYKSNWINERMDLLGRGGVMHVVLITDNEDFTAHSAIAQQLLAQNFSYVSGQKYSEFKPGDKVAAYGLSALVVGGGVAVAAKMGWLAKIGVFFLKYIKIAIFAVIGVAAAIGKFFKRLFGREEPPTGGV